MLKLYTKVSISPCFSEKLVTFLKRCSYFWTYDVVKLYYEIFIFIQLYHLIKVFDDFFARYEVVLLSVQESRRVATVVLALLFSSASVTRQILLCCLLWLEKLCESSVMCG